MRTSRAFTVIELIFVIVVLGILASVALPKFGQTGTQARVAAGKADVSAIRSAILSERQKRIIIGSSSYIPNGTGTYVVDGVTYPQMDHDGLFGGVLTYPKQNSAADGKWSAAAGSGTYNFNIDGTQVTFTYDNTNGTFTCSTTTGTTKQKDYCTKMIY